MAGVNSKMDHEVIEDKDILVVEACLVEGVPRSDLLSDNATHVPTSSVASVVIDIFGYTCTWMVKKDVMLA